MGAAALARRAGCRKVTGPPHQQADAAGLPANPARVAKASVAWVPPWGGSRGGRAGDTARPSGSASRAPAAARRRSSPFGAPSSSRIHDPSTSRAVATRSRHGRSAPMVVAGRAPAAPRCRRRARTAAPQRDHDLAKASATFGGAGSSGKRCHPRTAPLPGSRLSRGCGRVWMTCRALAERTPGRSTRGRRRRARPVPVAGAGRPGPPPRCRAAPRRGVGMPVVTQDGSNREPGSCLQGPAGFIRRVDQHRPAGAGQAAT